MTLTQPRAPLEIVNRDIHRCKSDIDAWKRDHDELDQDCWVWEDFGKKVNLLFERLLDLDFRIQELFFSDPGMYDPTVSAEVRALFAKWLEVACAIEGEFVRLERDYGHVDGAEELRRKLSQVRDMLSPDEEFFTGDALVDLCEKAIDDHRAGLTSSL